MSAWLVLMVIGLLISMRMSVAGAKAEIVADEKCRAVRIPEDAWAVRIAKQALATIGIDAKAVFITGFTDASIYNNHGIEMAVVGIGAQNEHSTEECVAVADIQLLTDIYVALLDTYFKNPPR